MAESRHFAGELQEKVKPVTLDVPGGDHDRSMIDPGIPHAIARLRSTLDAAGQGR